MENCHESSLKAAKKKYVWYLWISSRAILKIGTSSSSGCISSLCRNTLKNDDDGDNSNFI